jgi:hypothetical protein
MVAKLNFVRSYKGGGAEHYLQAAWVKYDVQRRQRVSPRTG